MSYVILLGGSLTGVAWRIAPPSTVAARGYNLGDFPEFLQFSFFFLFFPELRSCRPINRILNATAISRENREKKKNGEDEDRDVYSDRR